MKLIESSIVGVIVAVVGTIVMYKLEERGMLKYDKNYTIGLFILGLIFQIMMEMNGYGEWYKGQFIEGYGEEESDIELESVTLDQPIDQPVEQEIMDVFIPSDEFMGKKDGYVFKKDDEGLGYYLDNNLM